jgi:hypothetical protein
MVPMPALTLRPIGLRGSKNLDEHERWALRRMKARHGDEFTDSQYAHMLGISPSTAKSFFAKEESARLAAAASHTNDAKTEKAVRTSGKKAPTKKTS